MISPMAKCTLLALTSPWKPRIHGQIAIHRPIVRMIHSSSSKISGMGTASKRSAIENIARIVIAAPAIQDVCQPKAELNPNSHGDVKSKTPIVRLIKSTTASVN